MAKAKATIKSVVVVLEHTPDAPTEYKWSVHCPAIQGRTREEALKNIREVQNAYWELKASAYTARR
jgi:predicted RNase H-like HicB family nuclease